MSRGAVEKRSSLPGTQPASFPLPALIGFIEAGSSTKKSSWGEVLLVSMPNVSTSSHLPLADQARDSMGISSPLTRSRPVCFPAREIVNSRPCAHASSEPATSDTVHPVRPADVLPSSLGTGPITLSFRVLRSKLH